MTDRELLELAAKAAGIAVPIESPWGGYHAIYGFYAMNQDGSKIAWKWNPLADDGDALRLSVDLGLGVQVIKHYAETQVIYKVGYVLERHGEDPRAATRRAIVRAAAAIGKAMP